MKLRKLAAAALFAALTAAGAFIRVPTPWIPFTLQLLFVLLSGALLGPLFGALSQAAYVLLGLLGLPIFSGGAGFSYVLQPSFGFLLGFIPAAAVTGLLCRKKHTFARMLLAGTAGVLTTYLVGIPYMAAIFDLYLGEPMSFPQILMAGMIPFLPFDAVKIVLTALITPPVFRAAEKYLS